VSSQAVAPALLGAPKDVTLLDSELDTHGAMSVLAMELEARQEIL